jgi:hypothetical protein
MIITHQFLAKPYFLPNWEVDTLFIGTFNPSCGTPLDYYYQRKFNGFWKILKYYDLNNSYDFSNFEDLKSFMCLKRFGCVDLIRSVSFPDSDKNKICGNGYSDDNLFKVGGYKREYNFRQIKEYILSNKVKNVFSTWGIRIKPNEFRDHLIDFASFCSSNNVTFINLKSPSGRLYRGSQKPDIDNNWRDNLDDILV